MSDFSNTAYAVAGKLSVKRKITFEENRSAMHKNILTAFLLFVACLLHINAQKTEPVTSLSWMNGCWEVNDNGRGTTERWAAPTENLMLGTSQTVKNGKSVAFEFLRIVNNGHGLVYVALPSSAKEPTPFPLLKMGEKEVVFENLKHDFPQRVIYRQTSADSLFARIEGTQNGKLEGMDIPMRRVKCE